MAGSKASTPQAAKPKTGWRPTTMMNMRDLSRDDFSHAGESLGTDNEPLTVHRMDPARKVPQVSPSCARHASRYFELYLPNGAVEIAHTTRYRHKAGQSVSSRRGPLAVGSAITDLKGSLADLTFEEDEALRKKGRETGIRKDFSVIYSRQKNTSHLFLGPARFVNEEGKRDLHVRKTRRGTYALDKPHASASASVEPVAGTSKAVLERGASVPITGDPTIEPQLAVLPPSTSDLTFTIATPLSELSALSTDPEPEPEFERATTPTLDDYPRVPPPSFHPLLERAAEVGRYPPEKAFKNTHDAPVHFLVSPLMVDPKSTTFDYFDCGKVAFPHDLVKLDVKQKIAEMVLLRGESLSRRTDWRGLP
ncbi:hypothetical protein EXIGLDRAFT_767135 [Exidia glandulosa HHB12029]|uniref:Uncharacterized protein n=1 Tax=Exidia glandulosa HHB12029 TaxID=1314781 RepID=A0A165J679_EXIGL|nr:hypothetical protein EXIGLDRAFT_767135 [Exidia glandulosa HHB12029]